MMVMMIAAKVEASRVRVRLAGSVVLMAVMAEARDWRRTTSG